MGWKGTTKTAVGVVAASEVAVKNEINNCFLRDMIEKKKEQLSEKQREIMNEKDGSEPPAEKPEIK